MALDVTISGAAGSFSVSLGTTPPTLADLGGGWEEIPRPRRTALTEWRGTPAAKGTIQILFDWFAEGVSVQGDVEGLISAYCPTGGPADPPSFTISGAWPISSTMPWVCNGATFDEWIRDSDGTPVRAMLTLSLLQYVPSDTVITPNPVGGSTAAERGSNSENSGTPSLSTNDQPSTRTYTSKEGDTLSSIAASELGNWQRYTEIAELNDIRDPNNVPPGTVLQLP